MRVAFWAGIAGVALAGLVAACAPGTTIASGHRDYMTLCADCHGPLGKGDGPMAAGLDQRPADLTTIVARNDGAFPKARLMSHIYGFTMGRGDTPMPAFGDLLDGATVLYDSGDGIATPTPARLVGLIEYVEGLQE